MIALRTTISEIAAAMRSETNDGAIDIPTAIDRLRKEHPDQLAEIATRLIDDALAKLFHDVGRRRGLRRQIVAEYDLFAHFTGIPGMMNVGKGKLKDTTKLTLAEANRWLGARQKKDDDTRIRNEKFAELVETLKPYIVTTEDTLEDAMRRKLEAEGTPQGSLGLDVPAPKDDDQ